MTKSQPIGKTLDQRPGAGTGGSLKTRTAASALPFALTLLSLCLHRRSLKPASIEKFVSQYGSASVGLQGVFSLQSQINCPLTPLSQDRQFIAVIGDEE